MLTLRRLLTPSFAVALAALVVALGGTAIAAGAPFLTNVSFDVAAIC